MDWLITTAHIIVCILMIIFILLQSGKGAEMGAVFGGSSQTVFGSQGAASFLSKLTTYCAIAFMITSVSLVYIGAHESTVSTMDSVGEQSAAEPAKETAKSVGAAAAEGEPEEAASDDSEEAPSQKSDAEAAPTP